MGRIPRIAPPPVKAEPYSTVVIVPCYNEADRLPVNDFEVYAQQTEHIRFLFVGAPWLNWVDRILRIDRDVINCCSDPQVRI